MTPSEALTAAWIHTECAAQLTDVAAIRQHIGEIRKALRALDRPLIKPRRERETTERSN